jgi:hypothetical protein
MGTNYSYSTLKKENIESGFRFANVTPNDSTDIELTRAFMVNAAGDVVVHDVNGNAVTLYGLLVGVVYPFQIKRILDTGTTATSIVAIY